LSTQKLHVRKVCLQHWQLSIWKLWLADESRINIWRNSGRIRRRWEFNSFSFKKFMYICLYGNCSKFYIHFKAMSRTFFVCPVSLLMLLYVKKASIHNRLSECVEWLYKYNIIIRRKEIKWEFFPNGVN
jgi:hypothetical protein